MSDGGNIPPTLVGRRDAGTPGDASDGGPGSDSDAGRPPGCQPAGTTNAVSLLQDEVRRDFEVRRAYARWKTEPCSPAILQIGLTDNACVPGFGSQLVFELPRGNVGTTISSGANTLRAEPGELLRIRLTTLIDGVSPPSTFGTCAGVSGTLTFRAIGALQTDQLEGDFEMTLPDCSGGGMTEIRVTGSLDVTLPNNYEEICPDTD